MTCCAAEHDTINEIRLDAFEAEKSEKLFAPNSECLCFFCSFALQLWRPDDTLSLPVESTIANVFSPQVCQTM